MHFSRPTVTAAFVVLSFGGAIASAQTPIYGAVNDAASRPTAGWVFTPALGYAGTWDDNLLIMTKGDQILSGYEDALIPRIRLDFLSRRTEFSSGYEGSVVAYRDLSTLNSLDHRATVKFSHRLTRRLTVFSSGEGVTAPTTELLGVLAVPYVRIGSRLFEARGGVEIAFTRRTSLIGDYFDRSVHFEPDPLVGVTLLGGHSRGATATFSHQLNRELAVTANYDGEQASVVNNSDFNVQNGDAGIEWRPSPSIRVVGAFGISRLTVPSMLIARSGPAWRAGFTRRFTTGQFDTTYDRSFVPSYGFGGTSQNEEFTIALTMPIARRVYTRSGFNSRRNEPLAIGGLPFRARSLEGTVGYVLRPWIQVEGFYNVLHQNVETPGGQRDRQRIGFQIITAKPVRIH